MSLEIAAGTISSVIFAASNLPMLIKARRTRDLSSYSLSYLVMNNAGNLLYCLYVYQLPPGPIWAMQSFYLLSMGLLLHWYLRFTPPQRARLAQPASAAPTRSPANPAGRGRYAPAQRAWPAVTGLRCYGLRPPPPINRVGRTRYVEFSVVASTPPVTEPPPGSPPHRDDPRSQGESHATSQSVAGVLAARPRELDQAVAATATTTTTPTPTPERLEPATV